MASIHTVAQFVATDPVAARALHLTSRVRGRLDALETAIAGQDARARLRITLELAALVEELTAITLQRSAA